MTSTLHSEGVPQKQLSCLARCVQMEIQSQMFVDVIYELSLVVHVLWQAAPVPRVHCRHVARRVQQGAVVPHVEEVRVVSVGVHPASVTFT